MYSQGYISNVERYDAINEEHSPNFFKFGLTLHDLAPHFDNFILDQLTSMFHLKHRSDLSRSGLIVYTTLDINLQNQIQKIMQDHIAQLRDAHHLTNAAEVLIVKPPKQPVLVTGVFPAKCERCQCIANRHQFNLLCSQQSAKHGFYDLT